MIITICRLIKCDIKAIITLKNILIALLVWAVVVLGFSQFAGGPTDVKYAEGIEIYPPETATMPLKWLSLYALGGIIPETDEGNLIIFVLLYILQVTMLLAVINTLWQRDFEGRINIVVGRARFGQAWIYSRVVSLLILCFLWYFTAGIIITIAGLFFNTDLNQLLFLLFGILSSTFVGYTLLLINSYLLVLKVRMPIVLASVIAIFLLPTLVANKNTAAYFPITSYFARRMDIFGINGSVPLVVSVIYPVALIALLILLIVIRTVNTDFDFNAER